MDEPGYVDGRHYTEHVGVVKQLKRAGGNSEAVALLLRLVEATESEDSLEEMGVAPWYYEQLAILYRKQGDRDAEREILSRFARQRHAPGVKPAKLMSRLEALEDGSS